MGTIETLAARLAEDTMAAMTELSSDRLFVEIGTFLGASSQSLEEAYLTEIRVRLAERGARQLLERRIAELRAARGG